MASIREQTQHFPASSAPLAYPGDIVYLVYMLARLPGRGEAAACCLLPPLAEFADSEASNVCPVRSHFFSLLYFAPSNCQSAVHLTHKREGGSEEKEGNARQCMYSEARSWLKDGTTFLFLCQRCQVEQVVISRVSPDDIIPHVGGKIKPSHTHKYQERGDIVTVLSASLRSQWFRFHSHITPQGTKMKPDLCSYTV